MPALFWLIAAVLIILFIASPFLHQNSQGHLSNSSRRRSYDQADQLIRTAGSELLRGLNDQAYSHYRQARDLASAAHLYFLAAEANYGMAEVHERNQAFQSAAQCLREILATRTYLDQEKPGYAQMMANKLAALEAKIAEAKN